MGEGACSIMKQLFSVVLLLCGLTLHAQSIPVTASER